MTQQPKLLKMERVPVDAKQFYIQQRETHVIAHSIFTDMDPSIMTDAKVAAYAGACPCLLECFFSGLYYIATGQGGVLSWNGKAYALTAKHCLQPLNDTSPNELFSTSMTYSGTRLRFLPSEWFRCGTSSSTRTDTHWTVPPYQSTSFPKK